MGTDMMIANLVSETEELNIKMLPVNQKEEFVIVQMMRSMNLGIIA
jgi:hypothetical protein